ncbi:hypothetical protein RFI_02349 [Reticulomyxa filosa]|uniref:Uncharacterized protein n=1 Tax=Reticulomyxa filosa TaxID=46433 RepID=X6P985_RETFI|nr:hypothetical protein RFI_02349 [Reticulomyxa filosa]|eukprot:ETO34741.1 hypothetical protein RFI_02349 [Reticulomyxa filosa]
MEQLQEAFSTIEKDIIFKIWLLCLCNLDETTIVLGSIVEDDITIQQQEHLMYLLKIFGNQIDKITILKTWRNYDHIFVDTFEKLKDICVHSNLNGSQEENEFKILREMCLRILWNILKCPKHIKYRQINKQALYNNLCSRCDILGADFKQVFEKTENQLQYCGFKKENDDNWYCQYDHTQILHLWNCYKYWINEQIMFIFMCLLCCHIKQDMVFKEECVCYRMENGKTMKAYLIMNIEQ